MGSKPNKRIKYGSNEKVIKREGIGAPRAQRLPPTKRPTQRFIG